MQRFRIPYGRSELSLELPDSFRVEVLAPAQATPLDNPSEAVSQALRQPLGSVDLASFRQARSAAIAVSDKTRPVPHALLLPPLLRSLESLGIPPQAITLIVATGLHTPMTETEFAQVLPAEILSRYTVISHDANAKDLLALGTTSRGTPVFVNRRFQESELRLVLGNLEPHQFMGFSGGVKTAAIGLAGKETINSNHARMMDPAADLGIYEGNPAREDVEEIGKMMGVHFALNAVINENKQIIHVLAGEPRAVMLSGIPKVRAIYQVGVRQAFDLVVASPGGHPKDINLYQAQKALGHAARVTRPDGAVILVAACPEGSGSRSHEEWVRGMPSHGAVIERFKAEGYRIGPHKAFQLARDSIGRRVLFVSEMPPEVARSLLLEPAASLAAAVATVAQSLPPDARVGVLPWANATIPTLAPEPSSL